MSNKNRPFLSLFPRLLSRAGLALFLLLARALLVRSKWFTN